MQSAPNNCNFFYLGRATKFGPKVRLCKTLVLQGLFWANGDALCVITCKARKRSAIWAEGIVSGQQNADSQSFQDDGTGVVSFGLVQNKFNFFIWAEVIVLV